MRLHSILTAFFVLGAASAARAEAPRTVDGLVDSPKRIEATVDGTRVRSGKSRALFSPQAQLFLEQKDAPTASKTSLRIDGAPRLSHKSKD